MRIVRWGLAAVVALVGLAILLNAAFVLALLGSEEGLHRLTSDWRRIAVAHQLGQGRLTTDAAFARIYGPQLGPSPTPAQIRSLMARDIETGEPAVFDVILARYILEHFGEIDGRSLPSGLYLAAGPIGPDAWPGPILTHYVVFPRHGYLLVVPPYDHDGWRPAYEATASLRKDFRRRGDGDDLYAVVQTFRPGAYDFPSPGEPVHDLLLISDDPAEVARLEERLKSLSRRLDRRGLSYELFRRNSNSALACYLETIGIADRVSREVRSRLLLRLRLPGIGRDGNLPC